MPGGLQHFTLLLLLLHTHAGDCKHAPADLYREGTCDSARQRASLIRDPIIMKLLDRRFLAVLGLQAA